MTLPEVAITAVTSIILGSLWLTYAVNKYLDAADPKTEEHAPGIHSAPTAACADRIARLSK
jgi:hypothetical protein